MTESEVESFMRKAARLHDEVERLREHGEALGMPVELEVHAHRVGLLAGRLTAWAVERYAETVNGVRGDGANGSANDRTAASLAVRSARG